MSTKIELKKETDGDYGPIVRLYINDVYTHHFALEKEPNAESILLKAAISEQFGTIRNLREKLKNVAEFRSNLKWFLESR